MTRTPTPQEWAHAADCHRRGEPAGQLAEALGVTEAEVIQRAAAEQWDRRAERPAAITGDARCPVCGCAQDLVRESDGGAFTGRVTYAHPAKACVPVAVRARAEVAKAVARVAARTCASCDDPMTGRAPTAEYCHRCSSRRLRDRRAASDARARAGVPPRRAAQLTLRFGEAA